MLHNNRPMMYASEVETEVLQTGIPDFALAHGAGMITDTSKFVMPGSGNGEAQEQRRIYGVTALSLDPSGVTTFRGATFGIDSPRFINQVDALGAGRIIQLGVQADRSPRTAALMTSRISMQSYFELLQERGSCTLGGIVTHAGDEEGTMAARLFINTEFDALLGKQFGGQLGKLAVGFRAALSPKTRKARNDLEKGSGLSIEDQLKLKAVMLISSAAVRRDGPVIVKRPLVAQV